MTKLSETASIITLPLLKHTMRIFLVHNFYQQPGGEDVVFDAEMNLLREHGHEVFSYTAHNRDLINASPPTIMKNALWSRNSHQEIGLLLKSLKPDVAHFHNTFLQISPSAYYACQEAKVPVVQTLHNYRLLCPAASFFRDGRVCEDCLGKTIPWPGVLHGCWRNSRAQSLVPVTLLSVHRMLHTWREQVDVYIALTEYARQKYIEGGLPAEKIVVKPNFSVLTASCTATPELHNDAATKAKYALFVGRFSPEKGLSVLVDAWKQVDFPLKVVGGPLTQDLASLDQSSSCIEWLGQRSHDEVLDLMSEATVLIFPSLWYEGFPLVLVEAFSLGLPVVSSDLGGMSNIIEHGRTGLLFSPGDSNDLAEKIRWVLSHPDELATMRQEARAEYESKYTAEQNYQMLMGIYQHALNSAGSLKANGKPLQ